MASQNLSGLAVLNAAGYRPKPGPIIAAHRLRLAAVGAVCASSSNLAAISAAICTGPDVHPDPAERWKTGPFYALAYLIFAAFGASLVGIFAALPQSLIVLVAGLALVARSPMRCRSRSRTRPAGWPRSCAFAVTASGISVLGIGSAFWGLIAGLAVHALERLEIGAPFQWLVRFWKVRS